MKPSEISLFTQKEQTLLFDTENKRLEDLDEDTLTTLLSRVRRARKKYTDLDRRQSVDAMKATGRRAATSSSNERTRRKAEVMEDAVARVARYLSRAARANANELKRERIEAAKRSTAKPATNKRRTAPKKPTKSAARAKTQSEIISPARKGATSAANKNAQASNDSGKSRP